MLEFQHVPIKFRGLDQKTDEKNVTEGDFVGLENVVMHKTFRIESRSGYTRVNPTTTYAAVGAVAFSDSFAIVKSDGVIAFPNVASGNFANGPIMEFDDPIMLGGFQSPKGFDTAFSPNYAIHAVKLNTTVSTPTWEIRARVVSLATGEPFGVEIVSDASSTAAGTFAKVTATRATDDYLLILTNDIGWRIKGLTGAGASVNITVTPMAAASGAAPVDIIVQPGTSGFDIVVAWLASGVVNFATYNTTSATWSATFTRNANVTKFSLNYGGAVGRFALAAWDNTGKRAYAYAINMAGTSVAAVDTSVAAAAGAYSISSVDLGTVFLPWILCYNDSTGTHPKLAANSMAAGVDGAQMYLASKMSVQGNTTNIFWVGAIIPTFETTDGVFQYPLSYSNYALMCNAKFMFPFAVGSAFPPVWFGTTNSYLLNTPYFYDNKFRIASNRVTVAKDSGQTALSSKAFVINGSYGLSTLLPTLATMGKIGLSNQHGAILPIEGVGESNGVTKGIIGTFIGISSIQQATTGGAAPAIPDGTYLYLLVFSMTFADGTTIEVAQSAPISVTVASGPKYVILSIYSTGTYASISTIQAESCRVNIYRTKSSGSVYYFLDSVSLREITYTDNATDASLDDNPVYYAQGGVLEASIPPPAKTFGIARNRIFAVSAEEKDTIYYSTIITPDNMPRFNEVLRFDVSALGGEIVGIGELDDKIIIFKKYAIYAIFGDGPDEIGGGGYTSPQLICNGTGCISQRSIVSTPDGVMFQSADGIKICDRGLNVGDVGAKVADYESGLVVTGALNLLDRDQVWFFTRTGRTLVWDRYHQVWFTFTGQDTNAPFLYRGTPYFVRLSDGHLLREDATKYQDNVTSFSLYLESGWITLSGIQGFQRMRKFSWSGALADDVSVVMYSDFSTIAEETIIVDATTVGGVQWEIKPKVQKCEAKKFKITVANITGKTSFSAFGIEAGAKRGSFKKATTQRSGG